NLQLLHRHTRDNKTALDNANALGVENGVASIPSHSKPCLRLSPHTAPSLTVPLLWIQL
ncbi:RNA-dependent DNA polymerase, partial [Arthrospira platensis PCC 7345]